MLRRRGCLSVNRISRVSSKAGEKGLARSSHELCVYISTREKGRKLHCRTRILIVPSANFNKVNYVPASDIGNVCECSISCFFLGLCVVE